MQHGRKRLLVAMGAMLWPMAAYPQATTNELKALPPRVANRAVQHDLLSVLKPIDKIDPGMFRRLHGVGLTTRPFGTEIDGVCRRDAVTLWYAPTDHADRPEDEPLRPYSIDAVPLFHIITLPVRSDTSGTEDHVWRTKCGALGTDAAWFGAKDVETAARGAAALEAAVKSVKAGTLKARSCADVADAKAGCQSPILAVGRISQIDSIEPCPAVKPLVCYMIDLASSTKLTIEARFEEDALQPSAVTSIAVEEYILVT